MGIRIGTASTWFDDDSSFSTVGREENGPDWAICIPEAARTQRPGIGQWVSLMLPIAPRRLRHPPR